MRRLVLLVCIIAAVRGQQCQDQQGCEGKYSESSHLAKSSNENHSANLQDLFSSLLSFNPTLHAPGKCGEHSRIVRDAAKNLEVWALQMYDSNGRLSPALLNGNVNQFGDFDTCLNVEHHLQDGETIKGQYVLAFFDLQVSDEVNDPRLKHLLRLAHSYDLITSNFSDPGHRIPRFTTINWGVCVPASCSAKDVEIGLQATLKPITSTPELKLALKVDEEMMYRKEPFAPDLTTWLVILIFASLLLCVVLATLFDVPENQVKSLSQSKRICLAFSLKKTWSQLLNTKSAADDISCLHGLRFLNAFALIFCHKAMAVFFYPFLNRTDMTINLEEPWSVFGRTAILYTDTFIVLSGLLVAYTFIKDLDKTGEISLPSKLKARFIRITPNFAAIILFCTYILQFMGSGPQWNLVVKHHSQLCKSNMWRNFLYIHNYFGFENMCLTHTHQLGIDMQLFVVSPFLVYLVWKWPRAGSGVLIALASWSTWLRYTVTYEKQLSNIVYFGNSIKTMFDTCNFSYILPTHRLTVYIMGILTGAYLRKYPNGINFSKVTALIGWAFMGVVLVYPWFSPYNRSKRDFVYDVDEAANYAAYSPILWSILMIGVIFLCHQSGGSFLGSFMRWRGFQVFTKISYAVYLTQFPIFFYNVGITMYTGYYSMTHLFVLSEILVVLIASVLLTLFVDLPFQEIKKIVTAQGPTSVAEKVKVKDEDATSNLQRSASLHEKRDENGFKSETRVLRRTQTISNGNC